MFQNEAPLQAPLFTYYPPLQNKVSGMVPIPHSGEDVPTEFLPYLANSLEAMREDVDFKVNQLISIEQLQLAGIAVLVAHVHRVCVDLNRDPSQSILFWQQNTKGETLVKARPDQNLEKTLIRHFYNPFFELYESVLRELEKRIGPPIPVIDLHSMPSSPTAYHMKQNPKQSSYRPDFCISNQHGKTCSKDYINWFSNSLTRQGHHVQINDPYIGGYVTTFVNQFRTNNIQIEIKRSIYMDESTKTLIMPKAEKLKEHLSEIIIEGITRFSEQ